MTPMERDQARTRERSDSAQYAEATAAMVRGVKRSLGPWVLGTAIGLAGGGGLATVAMREPVVVGPAAPVVVDRETTRTCASPADVRHALDWLAAIATGLESAGVEIDEPTPPRFRTRGEP